MNKVFLVSLGCSKNLVDSQNLLGNLGTKGYELSLDENQADIFLINTCGFIGAARDEGYQVIQEALEWKKAKQGTVVVVGCLAQRETEYLGSSFPEIDVISGFGGYATLHESISHAQNGSLQRTTWENKYEVPEAKEPIRLTSGASAYMKLGEGCSKRCAFCSIPFIRGNQRSTPISEIVAKANQLVSQGVKEIILIAQDPVTYGKDLNENVDLIHVVDALDEVKGLKWVRLHYVYPGTMAVKVIDRMNKPGTKLLPYLDMPIQHADPSILSKMNRPGIEITKRVLDKAKNEFPPHGVLRTTFLLGFPGETEEQFHSVLDCVEQYRFDRVGSFTYSLEEDTSSFHLEHRVPEQVAHQRKEKVMDVAQAISFKNGQERVGKKELVLIDVATNNEGIAIGRTMGQSPEVDGVTYVQGKKVQVGEIVEVEIILSQHYDLVAHVH